MKKNFKKIIKLSDSRITEFEEDIKSGNNKYSNFYKGHSTYIEGIKDELEEAIKEIKIDNNIYLEDELGDVFWDYCCLLQSLEKEGYISSVEKVFERSYKKFSERIKYVRKNCESKNGCSPWKIIKEIQKKKLKEESKKTKNS